MVYKIRNKQFYAHMGGGMNSARVFPNKKTQLNPQLDRHVTFQVHVTRFTSLRLYHNYRNISRATKQFMMGDRFLEQLMILQLKSYYTFPNSYEAPIGQCFFLVSKVCSQCLARFLTKIHGYRAVTWQISLTVTLPCLPTTSTRCS